MTKGIILLAAGGTGGHLFPAEALAHELKAMGYSVHLVTDSRAERYAGKFPADEVHVVPSATIGSKNPVSVVKSLWTLWSGMRAARKLIARLKPKAVVGFGGYPTVPPLLAATGMGVPSIIHEQNAVMGRANKALASRVKAIAGGFLPEGTGAFAAKTVTTGNPVRPAVLAAANTPYASAVGDAPFHLVVFGGSQGAQYFSKAVPQAICRLDDEVRQRFKVTQQARPEDRDGVIATYEARCARRGLAVLHRYGRAHRRRSARHLPLRRLDGIGACGHRPAGDPRALSLCARSRPGGQCGRPCRQGWRTRDRAGRTHRRPSRRHPQ